jgi:peptidoglycan/xylan/chitin deacetylase (PgdA/CDA1 family)
VTTLHAPKAGVCPFPRPKPTDTRCRLLAPWILRGRPLAPGVSRCRPFVLLALLTLLAVSCGDVGQPRPLPEEACQDPNSDAGPWNGFQAAFTFSSDDNNDANLEWAKVFESRGVRFTIFTVPRWLELPGKLTGADLRDLHARGFEIGGHSMTHPRLTELDDEHLIFELQACRDTLTRIIGARDYICRTFAYPYHYHDARVMEMTSHFYLAARDGGLNSKSYPGATKGLAVWDSVSMFEVPLLVTIGALVNNNKYKGEETRTIIEKMLPDWTRNRRWVNVYAHVLSDCDTTHLGCVLDAVLEDGRLWVAPFGDVAAYYRRCGCR